MKRIFLLLLLIPIFVFANEIPQADLVVIKKNEKRLYLYKGNQVIKVYRVAFGSNPKGHKIQEGDEKTPEGRYFLDYKNADSAFYKSIHISYPNDEDKKRARKKGVNPGGQIMIHGQKNGFGFFGFITQYFNWTDGCIALKNSEMDEVWSSVKVNTPIVIEP
jgi:murein L,D-transpeptidase YafK